MGGCSTAPVPDAIVNMNESTILKEVGAALKLGLVARDWYPLSKTAFVKQLRIVHLEKLAPSLLNQIEKELSIFKLCGKNQD